MQKVLTVTAFLLIFEKNADNPIHYDQKSNLRGQANYKTRKGTTIGERNKLDFSKLKSNRRQEKTRKEKSLLTKEERKKRKDRSAVRLGLERELKERGQLGLYPEKDGLREGLPPRGLQPTVTVSI